MPLGPNRVRLFIGIAAVVVMASLIFLLNQPSSSKKLKVGIIEPMQHLAVSDVTRGIVAAVLKGADVDTLVQNANGDATSIPQIVARFKDMRIDVYVPIFTKTAQIVKALVHDKPIVFAAVTDPVSTGIVINTKSPEGNITGVSDLWPIEAQFGLIKQILPKARVIGIVFDPSDPSSSATLPIIKEAANHLGLKLELRPVHATNEMAVSLSSMLGKVDLVFTANDVTVTAGFSAVVNFGIQHHIPVFAGDYSSVERGAIGAVGQNYFNVGLDAGVIVDSVLSGRSISSIPVVYTQGGDLYLNEFAAGQMGVTLSDEVLKKAKQVYHSISQQTER